MLHFLGAANAVTLLGACFALAAALLATHAQLAWALCAFIFTGLCDIFDGAIARLSKRTEQQKVFGGRLDSTVDACAFGIVPPLLFYAAGLRGIPELILIGAYLCCAVWRLAYFDTVGLEGEGRQARFRGLPTTFSTVVIPIAYLAGFHSPAALTIAAVAACAFLTVAMISPVTYPKPRGVWYVIVPTAAVATLFVYVVYGQGYPSS